MDCIETDLGSAVVVHLDCLESDGTLVTHIPNYHNDRMPLIGRTDQFLAEDRRPEADELPLFDRVACFGCCICTNTAAAMALQYMLNQSIVLRDARGLAVVKCGLCHGTISTDTPRVVFFYDCHEDRKLGSPQPQAHSLGHTWVCLTLEVWFCRRVLVLV